jgi:hypothetical protein
VGLTTPHRKNKLVTKICREEGDHWEDQDVGWWTILRWILEKIGWDGIGLSWLRIGTSGGLL